MEEIAKRGVAPVSLTGTTWSEACSCSDQCANSRAPYEDEDDDQDDDDEEDE